MTKLILGLAVVA